MTACTYAISDYARLFDNLDTFYIDQQALVVGGAVPDTPPTEDLGHARALRVRAEEKEMVVGTLTQMIRCVEQIGRRGHRSTHLMCTAIATCSNGVMSLACSFNYRELLVDTNFHSAVQRVVEEPIPYFSQFTAGHEPSAAVKQSVHRHAYASAVEEMPSGGHVENPPPLPLPTGLPARPPSLSSMSECSVRSEERTPLSEPDSLAASFAASLPEQDTLEPDEKIKQ